jgi:hypothetical protein
MTETNPVYVQLGYNESLDSKREILSSEISLLNLIKIIKRYNFLRIEELKIKSRIRQAVKALGTRTREVQTSFPFLKIPQRVGNLNLTEKKSGVIKERVNDDLESQLKEIQERLNSIEKR